MLAISRRQTHRDARRATSPSALACVVCHPRECTSQALIVQSRADSHDSRTLLHRHAVVLGGAHRQPRQGRARPRARAMPRTSGGCPLDPARMEASSSTPPRGLGERSMNASSCAGATPSLPGSPATFTSIRISRPGRASVAVTGELAQGGLGGDRVDQPHVRHDRLDLAALQPADEVPRKQLAMGGDLRDEVLRAVLADEPDAGLGEQSGDRPPTRTWSRRAPRPRPGPARRRSPQSRSPRAPRRGSPARSPRAGRRSAQPRNSPLPTGASAFAPVGEEALVADRARSNVPHLAHPRRQQPLARDRLQVDVAGWAGSALRAPRRTPRGPPRRPRSSRPRAGADDRDHVILAAQLLGSPARPPRGLPPRARASRRGPSPRRRCSRARRADSRPSSTITPISASEWPGRRPRSRLWLGGRVSVHGGDVSSSVWMRSTVVPCT